MAVTEELKDNSEEKIETRSVVIKSCAFQSGSTSNEIGGRHMCLVIFQRGWMFLYILFGCTLLIGMTHTQPLALVKRKYYM